MLPGRRTNRFLRQGDDHRIAYFWAPYSGSVRVNRRAVAAARVTLPLSATWSLGVSASARRSRKRDDRGTLHGRVRLECFNVPSLGAPAASFAQDHGHQGGPGADFHFDLILSFDGHAKRRHPVRIGELSREDQVCRELLVRHERGKHILNGSGGGLRRRCNLRMQQARGQ
jgi:hypothetical protein